MATILTTASLPFRSGLPADVAVNTFWLAPVTTPTEAQCEQVALLLDAFYSGIQSYLHPRLNNSLIVRMYDQSDPEPRVPIYEEVIPSAFTAGSAGYAEEVAMCVSFKAASASGAPQARRRGRIYVGPLSTAAVTAGSTSAPTRPADAFITALAATASNLADGLITNGTPWCVFSRVDNIARSIVSGWIDNTLDTQRRRGINASARTVWEP